MTSPKRLLCGNPTGNGNSTDSIAHGSLGCDGDPGDGTGPGGSAGDGTGHGGSPRGGTGSGSSHGRHHSSGGTGQWNDGSFQTGGNFGGFYNNDYYDGSGIGYRDVGGFGMGRNNQSNSLQVNVQKLNGKNYTY